MALHTKIGFHQERDEIAVDGSPADENPASTATSLPTPDPSPTESSPKPLHFVVDAEQFMNELAEVDTELEQALAEEGLEEYIRLCPP